MIRLFIIAFAFLLFPISACKAEHETPAKQSYQYDIVKGQKYYYADDWQYGNMFRGVDHVYIVYRSTHPDIKEKVPDILRDDVILPMLKDMYTRRYQVEKPADGAIRHPESFDLRNQPVTLVDLRDKEQRDNFKENIFPNTDNLYVFYEVLTHTYRPRQEPKRLIVSDLSVVFVQISRGTRFTFESIDNSIAVPIEHSAINEYTLERIKGEFEKMIN